MQSAYSEASGSMSCLVLKLPVSHSGQYKTRTFLLSHCSIPHYKCGHSLSSTTPPLHLSSLTLCVDPIVKKGCEESGRSRSANSDQAAVTVGSQRAQSTGQTCVRDISAQGERKGAGSSWCAYAGSVCVFLHVIVDTVFDRTSSDYTEVKVMCPNDTVVKYYKYTNANQVVVVLY